MIPKHKRAEFIKAFGEKKTQALEDMLDLVSKAADDAGVERKELPTSFAELARLESAMNKADGVLKLTDQYQQLITNLANEYVTLIIGTVSQKEKAAMITKDFDVVKLLKGRISGQKEKASPVQAGPSMFAPRTLAGVAPLFGGPANVTKESPQDVNILDGIYGVNQSWGKPAPKNATVLDFIFGLNQQYGKGDKR